MYILWEVRLLAIGLVSTKAPIPPMSTANTPKTRKNAIILLITTRSREYSNNEKAIFSANEISSIEINTTYLIIAMGFSIMRLPIPTVLKGISDIDAHFPSKTSSCIHGL